MDENEIKEQIPEPVYKDLIDLFGKEETDKILKNERTDFKYLTLKIMAAKFKRRFGINFWLVLTIGIAIYLILEFFILL